MKKETINNLIAVAEELTPVEILEDLYLKREDKFRPFKFSNANGSKLRQSILLLIKNKSKIEKGVITCCSIHSPQAVLVAATCKALEVPCTIFYGGTSAEKLKEMPMPTAVLKCGAKIEIAAQTGRSNVLQSIAKKRCERSGEFIVKYGINLVDNLDVFLSSVAKQVQNIPDELDNLVVTCGSGITSTGILLGLQLFNKKVKKIHLVGVAPNRINKIKDNLVEISAYLGRDVTKIDFNYIDLFNVKGFQYEKKFIQNHYGINFHGNYEAKTYWWLKNNINYKKEKTLMWVVGGEIKV